MDGPSHGFCDGAQHVRSASERYRVSSFDTAVLVLQNDAGAERWGASDVAMEEVKARG